MPKNAAKTRFEGIFAVESSKRRHEGKPDVCYYYVVKVDGKRKWLKAGWRSEGYTAAAAHALRNQYVQGLRHGTALPERKASGGGLTFDAAWEAYDRRHLANLRSAEMVRGMVKGHLMPCFSGRSLSSIRSEDVERLKQDLVKAGLSAQTITHILNYLHRIYRQTAEWGMHTLPSPLIGVTKPRVDNARQRYLEHDEAKKLLEELKTRSPIWHDIAALSLATGARLTEIRSLVRGAVNLNAGVMEVRGKTGRRIVLLSEKAIRILEPRLEGEKTMLVFSSREGGMVSISATSFKRAVIACKLNPPGTPREQKVVFHTLRHTFASWLAIAGVRLQVIKELMGHTSLETTMRYAHLCPDQKKQAVGMVGSMLDSIMPAF